MKSLHSYFFKEEKCGALYEFLWKHFQKNEVKQVQHSRYRIVPFLCESKKDQGLYSH